MPPKQKKGVRNTTNNQAGNASSKRPNKRQQQPSAKSNARKSPAGPAQSAGPEAEDAANVCSVCAEPVQDWAVGHCAHTVCGDCSHRMRVLYNRRACVMCNAELKQVALVPLRHYRPDMNFEEAAAIPGAFQDSQVNMWFIDRARHQHMKNVRGWKCSHKACNGKGVQEAIFANSTQLRAHARTEHNALYCEICFVGEKSFVSEMPLFPLDGDRNYSSRLRGHLRKEHPQCRFCKNYYLDDEKLYSHLQEKHETCAICERNGRMHEYYINYAQLERHFQKEHYVCLDEACRGLVFATQIQLQAHEHTRHNDNPRGNRARALRVNLQQLHGERDPRRRDTGSDADVQREQERQAARRRAFLSSTVVFSGALTVDDSPGESSSGVAASSSQPYASSQARGPTGAAAPLSQSTDVTFETRRPDDGKFHPLQLPRDGEESQARNTILVRSMRSLLDPAAYEQFRVSSGQFHAGKISADEYYDAVVDAFGVRAAVRDILPELVALLPTPLLREPLLETCLQRTDTKPSGLPGPSASASGAASSSPGGGNDGEAEQFPTLNGAPAPRRVSRPMRRFGKPGPEEFPRLGNANKAERDQGGASSSSQASAASRVGRTQPSGRAAQQTAAGVLRQTPRAQRVFANQRVGNSGPQRNTSAGVQLPASAFPSLSSNTTSTASTAVEAVSSSEGEVGNSNEHVPADVSMRVGAVWGGTAAAAHSRGGKKRGPGRGQGRRPASPPKRTVVVSSATDFPDIRAGTQSQNASSSSPQNGEGETSGTSRAPQVVDVVEIARSRKAALANSSLPKIGGSGYGFAWDRKKAQQKRKEIKKNLGNEGSNPQE